MSDFYDLSDLILDPDFAVVFALIRRGESVDEQGRAQISEQLLSGRGVIQPATPKERERLPDGDQLGDLVAVYSLEPLLAGDDSGRQADQVAYLGRIYEVKSVENWRSGAGLGYSKALAALVGPIGEGRVTADNSSASGGPLIPAPGLTRREIEDVLHALIVALTGIPGGLIRPRWQPRPPTQPPSEVNWCAFGVVQREMPNFPQLAHDGTGEGSGRLLVHETLRCLASFYGPAAEELALALRNGLHLAQNREPLYRAGLAFVEAGSLTRLPELKDMGWRERCDLPLVFRQGPGGARVGQAPAPGGVAIRNLAEITPCTGGCQND